MYNSLKCTTPKLLVTVTRGAGVVNFVFYFRCFLLLLFFTSVVLYFFFFTSAELSVPIRLKSCPDL